MTTMTPAAADAREILAFIQEGEYEVYGLRVMTIVADEDEARGAPAVGSILANSRVWDDGEMTEEELDGTCAYHMPRDAEEVHEIENAIERFQREGYYGKYVVLIGGFYYEGGEDYNEVVIRDAKVLAVWNAA